MFRSTSSVFVKEQPVDPLAVELSYTVLKPFLTDLEQAYVELPPYFETDPRNGISSRSVGVHVEAHIPQGPNSEILQPFEEVEFSLYGVIRSQVKNKISVKKILHSTELRKWSDFHRHLTGKNSQHNFMTHAYYCDLLLPIDQSLDSRNPSKKPLLLPSIDISGSKYVTQSTALNDQHLISGRCQVIYCIEARFILTRGPCHYAAPNNMRECVGQLSKSSILKLQPSPSTVRLVPLRKVLKGEDGCLEVEAKCSNVLRMKKQCQFFMSGSSRQLQVQPKILFSILRSLSQNCMVAPSSGSTSTFLIPVTMTVSLPTTNTSTPANIDPIVSALRQQLTISGFSNVVAVASTWHTKYAFTTNPSMPEDENRIEQHTVRQENRALKFPPFYEITSNQYTATADLEISVPAGLPATSRNGLLDIQHFLSLAFIVGEEETSSLSVSSSSMSKYVLGMTANMRVECKVEA